MIDPVTAIAAASKAYAMTKAMVEAGRSAEDTMMQLGKWYGHASDVLYAEKKAKNVNPLRKAVFSKSVEAEAMNAFAAKKKLEAQQKELMEMINLAYGGQGLAEFRDLKRQIIKERQDTVYRQQEMKEQMLGTLLAFAGLGVVTFIVIFIVGGFQ